MNSSSSTSQKKSVTFANPIAKIIGESKDSAAGPPSNPVPLPPSALKKLPSPPTDKTTRKVMLIALCTFVLLAGAAVLAYRVLHGQPIRLNLSMFKRLI